MANVPETLPIVLLNCAITGDEFDALTIENRRGALRMVRHLLGLGHRRIAIITGAAGNVDAAERLRGYRRAMREAAP